MLPVLLRTDELGWRICCMQQSHRRQACRRHSQEEQDFVARNLKGDSWLGMSDEANEGNWVWELDGSSADYKNFNGGEPSGGRGENCGMIWNNGKWNDCGPGYNWFNICQKK